MPEEKIFIDAEDTEYKNQAHQELIRLLVFSLAKEHYCISVASAKQVWHLGAVTRVPNAPAFIKGVTNLAGQVIPLVDISFFLGIEPINMTNELRIIVMEAGTNLVGILVNRIEEVIELDKAALQLPLVTLEQKLLEFTIGEIEFKNRILVMLDLKRILSSVEFNQAKR